MLGVCSHEGLRSIPTRDHGSDPTVYCLKQWSWNSSLGEGCRPLLAFFGSWGPIPPTDRRLFCQLTMGYHFSLTPFVFWIQKVAMSTPTGQSAPPPLPKGWRTINWLCLECMETPGPREHMNESNSGRWEQISAPSQAVEWLQWRD